MINPISYPPLTIGILASGLLYCGRYDDTEVRQNPNDDSMRLILIHMANYPQAEDPVGEVPDPVDPAKVTRACTRVGFLYSMRAPTPTPTPSSSTSSSASSEVVKARTTPAGKISASLAHEKKMLSLVNVFAMLPM